MNRDKCILAAVLTAALYACSPSKFIKVDSNEFRDGVTIAEAKKHCYDQIKAYRDGVEHLEWSDALTKSGTILAGIGGIYEGVTGGNSRAITNFATAGTVLYAGQQFLIRRPTRVDIYNSGMEQLLCIIEKSPTSDSPPWVRQFKISGGRSATDLSDLSTDLVKRAHSLIAGISEDECDLPTTSEALNNKKDEVLQFHKEFQGAGAKILRQCVSVANKVSKAINNDSPDISEIQTFLSGVSITRQEAEIKDPQTRGGGVDPCNEYLQESKKLVIEIDTALDFALTDAGGQSDTCATAIVPQILRLAGSSPYTVKKADPPTELQIKVLGGNVPITVQRQLASSEAPSAAFDQASGVVKVSAGPSTSSGAFVFSVLDNSGSSVSFVVVVED